MMVIGDDAMHFCAREIKRSRNVSYKIAWDKTKLILNVVKNRQQCAWFVFTTMQDLMNREPRLFGNRYCIDSHAFLFQ